MILIVFAGPAQRGKRFVVGAGDSKQRAGDAAEPGDSIVAGRVHRESVAISTRGSTLRDRGGPPMRE